MSAVEVAEGTEAVEVQFIEVGDVIQFNDGRRLVVASDHGVTAFFQLTQVIGFMGDEREFSFPWGDMLQRVIR